MHYLKEHRYPEGIGDVQRARVRKRAAHYMLAVDGRLLRKMPDGSLREVPRPENRSELISKYHDMGHYGVRRTAALVLTAYWWHGLLAEVAAFRRQVQAMQPSAIKL
jgi:hypothetical protein